MKGYALCPLVLHQEGDEILLAFIKGVLTMILSLHFRSAHCVLSLRLAFRFLYMRKHFFFLVRNVFPFSTDLWSTLLSLAFFSLLFVFLTWSLEFSTFTTFHLMLSLTTMTFLHLMSLFPCNFLQDHRRLLHICLITALFRFRAFSFRSVAMLFFVFIIISDCFDVRDGVLRLSLQRWSNMLIQSECCGFILVIRRYQEFYLPSKRDLSSSDWKGWNRKWNPTIRYSAVLFHPISPNSTMFHRY